MSSEVKFEEFELARTLQLFASEKGGRVTVRTYELFWYCRNRSGTFGEFRKALKRCVSINLLKYEEVYCREEKLSNHELLKRRMRLSPKELRLLEVMEEEFECGN